MTFLMSIFIALTNLNKFHNLLNLGFKFHNSSSSLILFYNVVLLSLPLLYILFAVAGFITYSFFLESNLKVKTCCAKVPAYTDKGELIYVKLYSE